LLRPITIAAAFALITLPLMALEKGPKPGEPYALIFGTVYDAGNRPAQGVKIKFRRAGQKKPQWERTSDRRGEFALRVFPGPADYVVWPDLQDKQAAEKAAVKVFIEKDERRDISLHLTEKKP
jgi:hypothetical protein